MQWLLRDGRGAAAAPHPDSHHPYRTSHILALGVGGGLLFPSLARMYLMLSRGQFDWPMYLIMTGPLFLVGLLFLFNWRSRAELRDRSWVSAPNPLAIA